MNAMRNIESSRHMTGWTKIVSHRQSIQGIFISHLNHRFIGGMMLSEPPLAGREEELGTLERALQKAIAGSGSLFLISGEAGIGKTRLAKEFEERAATKGCKVIVGNCVPSAQIPYLVFLEALKGLSDERSHSRAFRLKGAAKRAAPDIVGAIPVVGGTAHALAKLLMEYQGDEGQGQRENLLFGTLELLKNVSAKTPLIVHLDDLQWSDSASIGMLHFLARNVRDQRILLLGTYRTEEVLCSEKGVHPFLDSLQVMRREGIVEEVNLRPLVEEEMQKVVSGMLQEPLDKDVIELIFKESGGSPLFAIETLRMLVSEGRLLLKDTTWAMTGGGEIHIPRTIQQIIARRMDKLSKEQRRVMECASVIGEKFDPYLISESIGIDELHLLDELDAISNNFQLLFWDEAGYHFTHRKIRDVTYDAISKPKREELHRRVASSLEKRLPDNALLGRLSWHFDQALDMEKCIKYSLLAGKYCYAKKAMREAKFYYLLVLAKTEGDQSLAAERLEALEGLGDLRLHLSSPGEWYSYYERFLDLNHDKKARARVLAKAAECLDQMSLADTKKANELLDEAELLSEGDPRNLAVIEVNRGYLKINDGKNDEALAHFGKAKDHFEKAGDSIGSIRCRNFMAASLAHDYRFTEAIAIVEELLPMAIKSGDLELIDEVELFSVELYGYVGQTELSMKYSSKVIQESEKMGMIWNWSDGLFYSAIVLELKGELEAARITLLKAFESAKISEVSHHITGYGICLGRCELDLGLMDSSEYHYEEVAKRMSTLNPNTIIWAVQSIYLSVLKADLLAAKGKNQESEEVFAKAIEECEKMHYWYELVNCRSRYGMSLAKRGMKGQAREQFDEAMNVAKRIGCEKRVQLWAKRVEMVV
jgi:hypothetical protein